MSHLSCRVGMGRIRELLDGKIWEWDLSFRREWEWSHWNGRELVRKICSRTPLLRRASTTVACARGLALSVWRAAGSRLDRAGAGTTDGSLPRQWPMDLWPATDVVMPWQWRFTARLIGSVRDRPTNHTSAVPPNPSEFVQRVPPFSEHLRSCEQFSTRPTATDVARSVVWVSVSLVRWWAKRRNGWTDRDAVRGGKLAWTKWTGYWIGCTLTPPIEYDGMICAAAMRSVVTVTVATC